jgi:hypothetical protein
MVNIFLKRALRNDKVTHQIKNMVLRFMGGGILTYPVQVQAGTLVWEMEKNVDRLPKPGLETIFSIHGCLRLGME